MNASPLPTVGSFIAKQSSQQRVPDGLYPAKIIEEKILTDNAGKPKLTDDGKARCRVAVKIRMPDGAYSELSTVFTVGVGLNVRTNVYAKFAQYIEIIHGIPCGDDRQLGVQLGSATGKLCKVFVVNNPEYTNIERFLAYEGPAQGQQQASQAQQTPAQAPVQQQSQSYAPQPAPSQSYVQAAPQPDQEIDWATATDSEIPF